MQVADFAVQHAAICNDVLRVAGCVDDLDARPDDAEAIGQFAAIHAGQDHIGEQDIDRAGVSGQFSDSRFDLAGDVVVKGQTAITGKASLPVELTLFSARWGTDTLSASLRAAGADLSIVQPLFGAGDAAVLKNVTGRLTADVSARGTPKAKTFGGFIEIANGSAQVVPTGVTISNVNGHISGTTTATGQDSIVVDSLRVFTAGKTPGRLLLKGWVTKLLTSEPIFNLAIGLDQFHALDRRSLADVYLTTTQSIRLKGSVAAPTLEGALSVDRKLFRFRVW